MKFEKITNVGVNSLRGLLATHNVFCPLNGLVAKIGIGASMSTAFSQSQIGILAQNLRTFQEDILASGIAKLYENPCNPFVSRHFHDNIPHHHDPTHCTYLPEIEHMAHVGTDIVNWTFILFPLVPFVYQGIKKTYNHQRESVKNKNED